jgi:hypothetical protein
MYKSNRTIYKTKLFCLIFYLFSFQSQAQKIGCKDILQWTSVVEKEYPNESFKSSSFYQGRNSQRLNKKVINNLYSDKYFVPVFGVKFDEMSNKAKNSIFLKNKKCFKKKSFYSALPWKDSKFLYPFAIDLTGGNANKKMLKTVKEYRQIRDKYNNQKQSIINKSISFNDMKAIESRVDRDYSVLFPSEISALKNLIRDHKIEIANTTIIDKLDANTQQDLTYTLISLLNFKRDNKDLYNIIDAETKNKVEALLTNKTAEIQQSLKQEENAKLEAIEYSINGVERLTNQFRAFDDRFDNYESLEGISEIYKLYKQKKTKIVVSLADKLDGRISAMDKVSDIESLNSKYLIGVDYKNQQIKALKQQVDIKRNELKAIAAEKKRIAEEKERVRIAKIEKERKALYDKLLERKNLIKTTRKKLRFKYESNLPKFEDLDEILQYYNALAKDKNSYDVTTAQNFIRTVENMGYMRENENNISDTETFTNSKGFKIRAVRLGDANDSFIGVSFIVPNAPKDLMAYYQLEMTSEYRDYLKGKYDPFQEPTDSFYVNSGRTLYSVSKSEEGNLKVVVRDNLDADFPVMVERVDPKTLEMTPWSSSTDIVLKKGDKIQFKVSGSIKLGNFLGYSDASGIRGYEYYNIVKGFNHGCLMGKIGEGNWKYIGSNGSLTADKNGRLFLKINDNILRDDDGSLKISYLINE